MSSHQEIGIRRAARTDAATLRELAIATFVETFGHLYPPEDLAAYLQTEQTVTTYRRLLRDPAVAIWLAVTTEGTLVGFITAGPCKLPVPQREYTAGEIRQLYLQAAVQGMGVGSRLLRTALDWLSARGHSPLYIGVWSENFGAQRLYGRHDFEKIGEYDFPVGKTLDREFILRRQKAMSR